MKYPYLIGERSPARTAQEFKALMDPFSLVDLRHDFMTYLERHYPKVFDRVNRIWELEIFYLSWPNDQSDFLIAICNVRNHTISGLFPTFKKAARALCEISKLGLEDAYF